MATHVHGAIGIERAIEAGVDSLEHGTFMTDDSMAKALKKGIFYVPTLTAGYFVAK